MNHVIRLVLYHGYRFTNEFVNVCEELLFFFIAEGERNATGTGASCSADSVNVRFRHIRKLVVDDVR